MTNAKIAKMEAVLKAVATELDMATDLLHYENGLAVTALEGWQIERLFDGLRTVNDQVAEIIHDRTAKKKAKKLPPDPDGQNDDRAEWAGRAISAFQIQTGTDFDDALPDLLCDLMHWCDRTTFEDGETKIDFDAALTTARMHYEAETAAE